MQEIGGYFELELRKGKHFHPKALRINTARNCLEYILRAQKYTKIYIPFYTCDVLLEPIHLLGVDYEFYSIDSKLNPIFIKKLASNEAFLYTNYYGVKQKTIEKLALKFRSQLIVDNSQSFFSKPLKAIDTFYSARKFFGVPDGAYLYTTSLLEDHLDEDISLNRLSHLVERIEVDATTGYSDYVANDKSLNNQTIKKMSKLTSALLSNIDYLSALNRRRKNFQYLHNSLGNKNQFEFDEANEFCPMVYPFYSENQNLRNKLIANKVYVATYWRNVLEWVNPDSIEYKLVTNLIPLPIDQRYNEKDMDIIIKLLS